MPLFAVGVVAYVAGLLLGFGGHLAGPIAAAVAGVVWSIEARRARPAALALLLCGGAFVARAAARSDARCRRSLEHARGIPVVLQSPAAPGSFASARAVACPVMVSLSVLRGSADAGSRAVASGAITSSARGLFVQGANLSEIRPGPLMARWREAAGRQVDSLFGADAPLARALLVADRRGLSADLRNRYAAAGLSHMLSISGLHVALIAVAVDLAFQLLRLSRRRASAATLVVIAAYVAMLGAPPPALRAAVMLGLWMFSRWWQRPTSPWAVLAVGAAIPLVDPRVVTDVGYQLSVAGVAALVGTARLSARWPWMARLRGVGSTVASTALASTMAATVTAPLVAWNFGRMSLIGPVANVFAAPVMAVVQPIMFLSLALSPLRPVARVLADAAHPLLRAFDAVASAAASVPGASIAVAPSASAVVLGCVFAVALVTACVSRFPGRAVVAGAAALALLAWEPAAPAGSGTTELHMIDVGQGEALALRTARGRWVVVDAGARWRGGDAGRSAVVPYVAHRGGRVAAFVLTAAAADRAGGAASVLQALKPGTFYDAAPAAGGDPYRDALLAARANGAGWHRALPGDSLVADEVTLTFPGRDSTPRLHAPSANRGSAIIRVRVGEVRILLLGNPGRAELQWLLANDGDALAADVVAIDGRARDAGALPALAAAVSPRIVLVPVDARRPDAAAASPLLERFAAAGAQLLRTDRLGSVVVRLDGRSLRVEADGDAWDVPLRSTPTPPAASPAPWRR